MAIEIYTCGMLVKVVGTLLVVGFVHPFYWWCAAAVLAGWVVYRVAVGVDAECRRKRAVQAALVEALERQDRWYIEGDPRGTYGEKLDVG